MLGITIPFTPFTGATANGAPLQTTVLIALTMGIGFTQTINVKLLPSQLPNRGIT